MREPSHSFHKGQIVRVALSGRILCEDLKEWQLGHFAAGWDVVGLNPRRLNGSSVASGIIPGASHSCYLHLPRQAQVLRGT